MENNNQQKKNNKKRYHRYHSKRKNKPENENTEVMEAPVAEDTLTDILEENIENLDFIDDIIPESAPAPNSDADKKEDEEQVEVVGIRFKKVGKVYYFEPNGIKASKGEYAIVETARGPEFGEENWSVYINGRLKDGYSILYKNGALEVLPPGLKIIVR